MLAGFDRTDFEVQYFEYDELSNDAITADGWGIAFKCEFEEPKSWANRTVWVRIQPEMVVPILRHLRDYANQQRRGSLRS